MADRRITVKLCSKKMPFEAISESTPQTELSISLVTETDINFPYEETTKAVAIVPIKHVAASGVNDCELEHSVIQIPLMAAGMTDAQIIDCLWGDQAELTWERGITNNVPNTYLTIRWSNPQDNCAGCFWNSTYIAGKNPYEINPVYPYVVQSYRVPVLGEIPQEGVEDDPLTSVDETSYWMSEVPATDLINETQPNFVPGEEIVLYWEMKIDDQILLALMKNVWFNIPLLTGGQIISKADENEVTQTWTVEALGQTIAGVMPTDFANYDIGSWVYLLRQGGEGNIYQRDQIVSSTDEVNQTIRAVPLDLSSGLSRVRPSGDFETKEFSLKTDFSDFEICYHEGIITAIDTDNNTADVTVTIVSPNGSSTQDFTDVSIFYHCPNSSDISNGGQAFKEGDSVLILNENTDGSSISASDLSVIGFTDKLALCTGSVCKLYLVDAISNITYYIYIDLTTASLFPLRNYIDGLPLSQPISDADYGMSWFYAMEAFNGLSIIANDTMGAVPNWDSTVVEEDGFYVGNIVPYEEVWEEYIESCESGVGEMYTDTLFWYYEDSPTTTVTDTYNTDKTNIGDEIVSPDSYVEVDSISFFEKYLGYYPPTTGTYYHIYSSCSGEATKFPWPVPTVGYLNKYKGSIVSYPENRNFVGFSSEQVSENVLIYSNSNISEINKSWDSTLLMGTDTHYEEVSPGVWQLINLHNDHYDTNYSWDMSVNLKNIKGTDKGSLSDSVSGFWEIPRATVDNYPSTHGGAQPWESDSLFMEGHSMDISVISTITSKVDTNIGSAVLLDGQRATLIKDSVPLRKYYFDLHYIAKSSIELESSFGFSMTDLETIPYSTLLSWFNKSESFMESNSNNRIVLHSLFV